MTRWAASNFLGFPPFREFLVVQQQRACFGPALALYEAVEPQQRLIALVGRIGDSLGLTRLLPRLRQLPAGLDVEWWTDWLEAVGRPTLGEIETLAFRVPPNGRVAGLLMRSNRAVGFVKQLNAPPPALDGAIYGALAAAELPFRTPRLLAEGAFRGVSYRLYEPLPQGFHSRPPNDVVRVRTVIDAWQACLSKLQRPDDVPADAFVCHSDFTPRNLRVASDGRWWLIDWDNARWGPRLADELHYWCAEFCWRLLPLAGRDARRVLKLMRQRGSDEEIAAAADWSAAPARTYRPAELQLRAEVGRLARR